MKIFWRGNVNAWECDELGHLNVRFYLAKIDEAIGVFCEDIGMRGAYGPSATAYLNPSELIIRFLAEARPGTPLTLMGGVTHYTAESVELALILENGLSQDPVASFLVQLNHVTPRTGKTFNFSTHCVDRIKTMIIDQPTECKTRSLDLGPPSSFTQNICESKGLEKIGRGLIQDHETNIHGQMRLEYSIGKISDSAIHFMTGHKDIAEAYQAEGPLTLSSAVLEARLHFHALPKTGTGYSIYTGLSKADKAVRNLVHWVVDSQTGKPLWSMQAVTCTFDLQTRRLKKISEQALSEAQSGIIQDLKA